MKNTAISWATHTFNAWEGCQKVGAGCDHCYAEARNARFSGGVAINWGPGASRRRTSAANWSKPRRWAAESDAFFDQHGHRQRVFCSSLADVFDNAVDPQWRTDLFALIAETPQLDWLLLTKRIGNVKNMLPADWGEGWAHVWIGATVVNQEEADRDIPKLLSVPAALRFLSVEPMLGPIDLQRYLTPTGVHCRDICADTTYVTEAEVETVLINGQFEPLCPHCGERGSWTGHDAGIDWVIVGGESGYQARPMHPSWPRSIREQCHVAGVPFLFKQWGEWGEFVNEAHYTHGGGERRPHAWVDAETGDSGRCWLMDDDGLWVNHTGAPRTRRMEASWAASQSSDGTERPCPETSWTRACGMKHPKDWELQGGFLRKCLHDKACRFAPTNIARQPRVSPGRVRSPTHQPGQSRWHRHLRQLQGGADALLGAYHAVWPI